MHHGHWHINDNGFGHRHRHAQTVYMGMTMNPDTRQGFGHGQEKKISQKGGRILFTSLHLMQSSNNCTTSGTIGDRNLEFLCKLLVYQNVILR
jgi:hypothetical protein